ncbi:MAG: TIGR00266 family protein [Synechocystis sp.]|nr:TIGR00266 family protein [Synechocystis sp.]
MQVKLINAPHTAIAQVNLDPKEECFAQNGSLVAMTTGIDVQSLLRRSSEGGKQGPHKRGQAKTLYLNNYQSGEEGGELYLAPALIGNLGYYQLESHKLIIRQSAYLASSEKIEIFMGYRSPVKNESVTWLSLVGKGQVVMSGFGNIYEVPVDGSYTINCDHLIAFENSLKFKVVTPQNPWPKFLIPDQETFYQFRGSGKLLCQTHRPFGFAQQIGKQLKPHNFRLH